MTGQASLPVSETKARRSGAFRSRNGIVRRLALAVVLATPVAAAAQTAADLDALRAESLRLVNQERAERGLAELSSRDEAGRTAAVHASDMLDRNFYDHVSPEGETVLDRYLDAGGIESHVVLENISQCRGCSVPADADAVARMHQRWMQSPGHRENILADGIAFYGFALAENPEGTRYGVQVFAGPGVPRSLEDGAGARPLDAASLASLAAEMVNEVRGDQNVAVIAADERLVTAAENLMPDVDLDEPGGGRRLDLHGALPAGIPWRRFQLVMGGCTGCGTHATDADVRFFVGQWLDDPAYRNLMLDGDLSHVGLSVDADGEGRKTAVVLLAG